ncbi:MAG: manganese efflux pump MntP family protein [Lachnospiraceae bacterium]
MIALTMDSFILSFAYGMSKCRPRFAIVLMMNVICSALLGAALFAGRILGAYIPVWVTQRICFFILFGMGSYKILSLWLGKKERTSDKVPELAYREAALLAFALSLDGLAVGVGVGMQGFSVGFLIAVSFLTGVAGMFIGWELGYRSRLLFSKDMSWICGLCLILLSLGVMIGL